MGIGDLSTVQGWVDTAKTGKKLYDLAGNLGSLYGDYQNSKNQKEAMSFAQQQAAASDPFGPYRQQYATELANITADPSQYLQSGEVTALRDEMRRALERRAAKTGHYYGGGLDEVMARSEGSLLSEMLQKRRAELAGLAGSGMSPSAAATQQYLTANTGVQQSRNQSIADLFSTGKAIYDIFA